MLCRHICGVKISLWIGFSAHGPSKYGCIVHYCRRHAAACAHGQSRLQRRKIHKHGLETAFLFPIRRMPEKARDRSMLAYVRRLSAAFLYFSESEKCLRNCDRKRILIFCACNFYDITAFSRQNRPHEKPQNSSVLL